MWNCTLVGVAEYGQISNGEVADQRLVFRIVHDDSTDIFVGFKITKQA